MLLLWSQALKEVLDNNSDSALNNFSDRYCSGASAKNIECVRRNPIMIAAFYGSLEALNLLLCKGADVNLSSSDDGYTALHCAAAGGSDRVVQVRCHDFPVAASNLSIEH